MAEQIIPDAWLVYLPKPCVPKEKMVGNMMELNKPMASSDHMATFPPETIASTIKATTAEALNASSWLAFTLSMMKVPAKRPTIAPPQYKAR